MTFVWNQAPVLNLECSLSIISQIVQGANEDELNMANVPAALYSFSLHTELWRITLLNIVLTQSGIFFLSQPLLTGLSQHFFLPLSYNTVTEAPFTGVKRSNDMKKSKISTDHPKNEKV